MKNGVEELEVKFKNGEVEVDVAQRQRAQFPKNWLRYQCRFGSYAKPGSEQSKFPRHLSQGTRSPFPSAGRLGF